MNYEFDKTTGTITKYLGTKTDVIIPSEIDGVAVRILGDNSFYMYGRNITSVKIPDSVTTIKYSAFTSNKLTNVEIPNSVVEIGRSAFSHNELIEVKISNNLKTIETYAFGSNELTSVTLPNSLTEIGEKAFASNKLTSVKIPNGVTKIGEEAFYDNKLTSVEIPSSVEIIEDGAFWRNELTSIEIPNSVKFIERNAFRNNNLTSIKIPSSITKLAERLFEDNNLVNIEIPDNITEVAKSAFAFNELTNIVIPDSVVEIGEKAFIGNELTCVTIGKNVVKIERDAFEGNNLTNIAIKGEESRFNNLWIDTGFSMALMPNTITTKEYIFEPSTGTILKYLGDGKGILSDYTNEDIEDLGEIYKNIIDDNEELMTMIQENAKVGAILKYVESEEILIIPNQIEGTTVKAIGYKAFASSRLTSVKIPNSVTMISKKAFEDNRLTNIDIPNKVVEIGEKSFSRNKLIDVKIPESVMKIGSLAFDYNKLTSVEFGEGLTEIGAMAFYHNQLTRVYIPESVTKILYRAFGDNPLETIKLPRNLEEIGERFIDDGDGIVSNLDKNIINYSDEEIVETIINLYEFTETDEVSVFEILSKYQSFENRYLELTDHENKKLKNLGTYLLKQIEVTKLLDKNTDEQIDSLKKSINSDAMKKIKLLKLDKLPKLKLKETGKKVSEEVVQACIGAFLNSNLIIMPPENRLIENLFEKEDLIKLGEYLLKQWDETGMKAKTTSALILSTYYADDNLINKIRDVINKLVELKKFKPMLQMLKVISYNGSKTSLRLLNSVANNGTTSGQKKEAKRLLEKAMRLANITHDQLLDMTTLDFGFDDKGVLKLTSGKKSIEVLLEQNFELTYKLEDGTIIKKISKNLEKFKKEINALKKEIKSTVSFESSRLSFAFLKAKRWNTEIFKEIFVQNTFQRQLASGLIFAYDNEDGTNQTFTLTKDKTLETANYEEVSIENIKEIYLIHNTEATEEILNAWQQYIKDNELKPLVDQVSAKQLNSEWHSEYEIVKYNGAKLTVNGLYSKLKKIDFTPPAYGPYSTEYEMHIDQFGITAHLNLLELEYHELDYKSEIEVGNIGFTKNIENKQTILKINEVPKRIVVEIINELDKIFK